MTLTVTIKEQDDPVTRKQAQEVAEAVSKVVSGVDAKLKQIYADQLPRGVRMS